MPGLSKKETARLLDYIEPQGVKVTPVKNGFMLRLPNGESTTVHLTGSDHRGPSNMRAFLKRNGIEWPTDKQQSTRPSKVTLDKGNLILSRLKSPPAITQKALRKEMELVGWHPTAGTIANYMRYKGYEPIGHTMNLMWKIPSPIVTSDELVVVPEPNSDELSPIVSINSEPLSPLLTKETTIEVREFLDSHDSWTVNTEILPDTLTLKDMKLMFLAMGISFEVRVWK